MPSRIAARGEARLLGMLLALGLSSPGAIATATRSGREAALRPALQPIGYRDGHARPRALAVDARDGFLYVASSTRDELVVVDAGPAPAVRAVLPVCAFPSALAPLPQGGVLVSCRFDPIPRVVEHPDAATWTTRLLSRSAVPAPRAVLVAPDGAHAYVASAARGGVATLALPAGELVQERATGRDPHALTWLAPGTLPAQTAPLLLVTDFVGHAVGIHRVAPDGTLSPAEQTLRTEAPVLAVVVDEDRRALLLFTHEDRPLSRAHGPVEGLDSVVLVVPFGTAQTGTWFADPGLGKRHALNFSERHEGPVVELAAAAANGVLAVVGAGSDNLWLSDPNGPLTTKGRSVAVGTNPVAVAALPGGRFVTADRLSDTLTFVDGAHTTTLALPATAAAHATPGLAPAEEARFAADARRGEVLFFSTALVPHNVADGPLSLYTCAACHDDGHVDGRRHPAKKNRFFSMTKTCRGLATTQPFLSLGEPTTLESFAANIVATHAQGAERDPDHFDEYPVDLRLFQEGRWQTQTLSPAEVRTALAAYMARIPPEPSPFVASSSAQLSPVARRGLALFADGCAGCHQLVGNTARANPLAPREREARLLAGQVALTSPQRYDVGTPVLGRDGNNPPSLRGVWENGPYFSDGSAATLEDVLRRTDPHAARVHAPANATQPAYDDADRDALVTFLRAL